jgi:hypothetical protein
MVSSRLFSTSRWLAGADDAVGVASLLEASLGVAILGVALSSFDSLLI